MTCKFLGEHVAYLVEQSRSGISHSDLYKCQSPDVPENLTHKRHCRSEPVVVKWTVITTVEKIACCNNCPFKIDDKPPPKPRPKKKTFGFSSPIMVGSCVSYILSWLGIKPDEGDICNCKKFAAKMDRWGPDECLLHMEEILAKFEEAAAKRGIPYNRAIAERMVRICIWRARRTKERMLKLK